MPKAKKPVNWGRPGDTGVSKYNGTPWYVPENAPTLLDRVLQAVFRLKGDDRPIGARDLRAGTAAEAQSRLAGSRSHRQIAQRLNLAPGEELQGFVTISFNEHVPQPPATGVLGRAVGPVRKSWMGGGWDSMAGRLLITIGRSTASALEMVADLTLDDANRVLPRGQVWVRTSHRILLFPSIEGQDPATAEYRPGEIGVRPGWQPDPKQPGRVDIAFADGSWIGVEAKDSGVPGGSAPTVARDLLVRLAGPPVPGPA